MILIIKHIEVEGPGTIEKFFKDNLLESRIVELSKGETLPTVDKCEAIICLGGPMSVYETDKYQFLTAEEHFLKQALDKKIPILGICLGAQLLAKVCGAEIRKAEQEEIGWYTISLTGEGKNDPLFKGLEEKLNVFQWHEDTFDIPKGATLIAKGTTCKNQAIRIGEYAWGFQFHPEITEEMLKKWIDYYLVNLDRDKLLNEYFKLKDAYNYQAKIIYSNFMNVVTIQQSELTT